MTEKNRQSNQVVAMRDTQTREGQKIRENTILPLWQFLPEYPGGHAQWYSSGSVFMQVPPLIQG